MIRVRKGRRDLLCMMIALALYAVNRLFLKNVISGTAGIFFSCYFNDLLCPLVLIPMVQLILESRGCRIIRYSHLMIFILACGVIWECFIPLIKEGSVCDPLDFLCYFAGASIYFLLMKGADLNE